MQERRRLPDGFLLMLLSHHFVVAFLVLTTFVVEPAVYNFMQTQKERKPCKIKASAANKRSARRRTRSGGPRTARTGAERRHRTFEPWQGSKKERYRFGIVLFSSARRGSNPQSIFKGNAENTGKADKHWVCGNIRNVICATEKQYLHALYNTMQHECTMKCNMTGYVAMLCSSINFTKSF